MRHRIYFTCLTGAPEGEKKMENIREGVSEQKMAKNFPDVLTDVYH